MSGAVQEPELEEVIVFGASRGSGSTKIHIPREDGSLDTLCGVTGRNPKRKPLSYYPGEWRRWCDKYLEKWRDM